MDGFCPFKDVNVRKAIMLGIDRLSFIKNYLKEDEKAFIASLWPNSYWYNTSLTPYPYDPDQANQLLDDGWLSGGRRWHPRRHLRWQTGQVLARHRDHRSAQRRVDNVLAIQSDLKKIGIDIKPNHLPAGTFFGSYPEGADMQTRQVRHGDLHHRFLSRSRYRRSVPLRQVYPTKDKPTGQNNYHICDPEAG